MISSLKKCKMVEKRTALFWAAMQRVVVISYPRFKNTEDSWNVKMGPMGCPETSVRNYYSLRDNAEERSSHLFRGGSLKTRNTAVHLFYSTMTTCPSHPTNSEPIHIDVYSHLLAMSISTLL
jgi:hypothetical protein